MFLERDKNRFAQRGQVLPLVAIYLATLLGFAALAVDAGYLRYEQRIEQSAADSAAVAGATELMYPSSNTTTVAQADAARNGFTNDGTNTIVTAVNPPPDGAYANNNNAVEVTVRVKHPSFFSRIFGMQNEWVTATAVGLLKPNAGPDCIYVLKETSTTTLNGSTIDAPSCGIIANGAWTANGATVDAQTIGVVGRITSNSARYLEGAPQASVEAADPCKMMAGCAYLKNNPPATTPCDHNNFRTNGSAPVYVNPGVYCGRTTFNGASTVNFNAGTFVFTGDVVFNGVQMISGSGVTFVLPNASQFTFNGNTSNLTAPTTGNTAGILFYAPNSPQDTLNGGSGSLGGALYFPQASLTFNGNSNSYFVLITGTLTQNGQISDVGPGSGGSLIREGVLAQ